MWCNCLYAVVFSSILCQLTREMVYFSRNFIAVLLLNIHISKFPKIVLPLIVNFQNCSSSSCVLLFVFVDLLLAVEMDETRSTARTSAPVKKAKKKVVAKKIRCGIDEHAWCSCDEFDSWKRRRWLSSEVPFPREHLLTREDPWSQISI